MSSNTRKLAERLDAIHAEAEALEADGKALVLDIHGEFRLEGLTATNFKAALAVIQESTGATREQALAVIFEEGINTVIEKALLAVAGSAGRRRQARRTHPRVPGRVIQ